MGRQDLTVAAGAPAIDDHG